MAPPPDDTSESLGDGVTGSDVEPSGPEDAQSLGDQHTFDGVAKDTSPQSLGDAQTVGGTDPDGETPFDDGMEVVDLDARYTTEGVLGKGGMGEVLLATDTRLKRKVAIKRVLGDLASNQTAVRRFMTEAQSIAALSNHPNIVDIYDFGRDQDGPFLIMEYIDGGCLLDRCQDGPLPLEEAVDLTCQLCGALEMAHEAGIIHRDIKPANVLLTKNGIPALTDFGLAKDEVGDTGHTMAGAVLGTLDFMPPEQRRDAAEVDARSDLWSLAATLYQMVTGESPRVIDLDGVPQQLRQTFAKALKTKKDDRYQTVREFREALQGCLAAVEPAPEVAVDLGAGECPQCHTKNEATRKFCRECAASLRVECLKCAEEIPVWDKVCAECGGKQAELLEQRRSSMQEQRNEAEVLGRQYEYKKARTLVEQLRSEPDVRLQQLQDWATGFLESLASEESEQQERVAGLLGQADQHRASYDYASAEQTLEQIPEPLRTSETSDLLVEMERSKVESSELFATIRERIGKRIGNKDLKGLLGQVTRALELRPDRQDLQKIKGQLKERERKATLTVDLVFLIDATGSMQPCIDDLKKNIVMFMSLLEEGADANSQSVIGDWRARVCAYRDWDEDDEPWIENPFVTEPGQLEAQLETLVADGGGDEPESLLDGMYKAVMCGETDRGDPPDGLKWRHRHEAARNLIVFTDATYHPEMLVEEAKGGNWEDVARVIEANRVIFSLFAPDFECYNDLTQIDRCEWEAISFDAEDRHGAVKALRDFTGDEKAFKETLEALAASIRDRS